ncbi:MAG: hypothetical protein IKU38_04435 [Clostridia bacterium]|nr:hypothetical protein [Clostridia bacterium]
MKNKCRIHDSKFLKGMLIVGLVLIAAGALAGCLLPQEAHLATGMAGMASGMGSSLAVIGGVLLLRRRRLGEARAKDAVLMMTDERGMAVAYKAQSAAAIAAVIAMAAMMITALVRGDEFYAFMGSALLCAVALVKLAAWHIYNRSM